jgi:hypothetical protein
VWVEEKAVGGQREGATIAAPFSSSAAMEMVAVSSRPGATTSIGSDGAGLEPGAVSPGYGPPTAVDAGA